MEDPKLSELKKTYNHHIGEWSKYHTQIRLLESQNQGSGEHYTALAQQRSAHNRARGQVRRQIRAHVRGGKK